MTIAIVAAFCVLLLILAFLFPRLSRGPERGGAEGRRRADQGHLQGARQAGHWLSKPFRTSQKAIDRSGSAGRRGRDKMPL